MTAVRLVIGGSEKVMSASLVGFDPAPSLLCSYVYYDLFTKVRDSISYREWVLDSGAFSARSLGVEINLQEYIDFCKELQAGPCPPTEIFSLDVIGDWRASLKNNEEMWKQGVKAIPCFHGGEPWEALTAMAADYPKIALGGMLQEGGRSATGKRWWIGQCFARVWPKKIHGFGVGGESLVLSFPWHSVDASNWTWATRYRQWVSMGNAKLGAEPLDLRSEVGHFLRLEERAKHRWLKELAQLDA